MKKAIVTFGVGPHAELLEIALPSFRAFAERHGYDLFIPDKVGESRPPSWWKVPALLKLLKGGYDLAVFFGSDLVVVDGRDDFDFPAGYWQAVVAHDTGDGQVPNCDMWLTRPEMIPWLEQAWELTEYNFHGWWEQAAILKLMGYEPDPRYRPMRLVEPSELYHRTRLLDKGWNAHVWDRAKPERIRIQHATMYQDRAAIMRVWAEQAKGWMAE